MRKSHVISAFAAAAALFLAVGCRSSVDVTTSEGPANPSSKLAWSTDFNAAKADAKKSGKLMMVDFNATWCGPCQQYKQDVFPTAEFSDAAKDYVLVDIDIDQQQDLAQKYQVDSIPDIRILDADGKEVGKVVGYGGAEPLLSELKRAKSVTR
jgi:thiol:disulfide interchange protein